MKKILNFTLVLFFASCLWAQNGSSTRQETPTITARGINRDEKPVRLSQVKIDVKVIGSLAVTTVDMTIHNPNNRVMEGELEFPLAEGQSISRFALDMNGVLREGVTVEKAKGQATFESVIRQKIDPALLEQTVGNNFRTRVYPLTANGTRRVVIAYEQELDKKNDAYRYRLPIDYGYKLDEFSIDVVVFGSSMSPTIDRTPWGSFGFDKQGEAYVAKYSAKNYEASGQIVFSLPISKEYNIFVEKGSISGQYLFFGKVFPEVTILKKELPKTIDLYWDISGSMEKRNIKLELELLDKYFSEIKNVTVNLITFNIYENKPQQFDINNGNWQKLKSTLLTSQYDGATQLSVLDLDKSQSDEILLFTDGLSNIGEATAKQTKAPINVIASSLNSDYSNLRAISLMSGGKYINLMRQSPEEALISLMIENFRLIATEYNTKEITDFATSGSLVNTEGGFSFAGKLLSTKASIILKFGIGKKVLYTEKISISRNEAENYGNIVERMWAAKQIAQLDLLYDKNKAEITALGKKYNIVTRNTSLIVLETVEDYVRFDIIPPAELRDEYNELIAEQKAEKKETEEELLNEVISMLNERKTWWNKTFKAKPKPEKKKDQAPPLMVEPRENATNSERSNREPSYSERSYSPPVRPTIGPVNGTVADSNGDAIVGCSVVIKGTNIGVVTDTDGGFHINAKDGDILQFRYIGFNPLEKVVSGTIVDAVLEEDQKLLEEVVVVSYASIRRSDITGSISTITPASDITKALTGRVAGVSVVAADEQPNIRIRGAASTDTSAPPLYLVDGVLVENLNAINPEDIKSVNILKSESAIAIYGSAGANGVVIVRTKDGNENEDEDISLDISENEEKDITLNNWQPDAPYMDTLKMSTDKDLYSTYLSLRKDYKEIPSFYLDAATVFEDKGLKTEALLILSNLAEISLQDYRLMRVLGYRFLQLGYTDYAINQFEKVLELRPEEPQSYRDLALAIEQNKNYQKAVNIFNDALLKEWDGRFDGIQIILAEEMNHTIAKAKQERASLDIRHIDQRLISNMPVDIRIVLNWDSDNSDMDLWVTDPNGEKCYYSHPLTEIGGKISRDFTQGYGPEEFLIKKAVKGIYKIEADYFGTSEQTLIGPTTIYLDIFTNYGRPNEKKQTIMLRLSQKRKLVSIGEVSW